MSFKLEGSTTDGGLVRAADFADWLSGVLHCLRRLEGSSVSPVETVCRITHLSTGSAALEIEVTSEGDSNQLAATVSDDFIKGIRGLRAGRIAELPFDDETKSAFLKLARPLRRQLRRVEVQAGDGTITISPSDVTTLAFAPEISAASVGAVSGFIDAVNVHKEPLFYVYPTAGPRIRCEFDPQLLLESVRSAIKRYATVHGLAEYTTGSPFPSRIVVDRVDVNPPESELPTLMSLFGLDPMLTGGMDSVAFVRRQRDAEA